ncbi:MAG: hypothetical protein ABI639_00690 [Thermoanaerobaculia bacterium]
MRRSPARFVCSLAAFFFLSDRIFAIQPIYRDDLESASLCGWSLLSPGPCVPSVVFVSRQIPNEGSIYWSVPNDMPGVGPHSRFRVAAPGRLLLRRADGTLLTLVDGSNPQAPLHLIDVNAPDVSWDGHEIVFAGLPSGTYDYGPANDPGAWRIFAVRSDGTNLRAITVSDEDDLDLSQFGAAAGGFSEYDDTDPAWLPDGRVVFSSTRWRARGHYSGVRASNLFVVNADGSNLHRITSERSGADRPLVEPATGRIVYSRWWRNHRFGTDSAATVTDPNGGYRIKDGLTTDRNDHAGGTDNLWRNAWQASTIRPDGTELALWAGSFRNEEANHVYGGAFAPDGTLVANYFPMYNMTEAAGFGGLRRFARGPNGYAPLLGITTLTGDYVHCPKPGDCSYGIFNGNYAGEPDVLPDGRILISWAADVAQDYGLDIVQANGTGRVPLFDLIGTTELRARLLRPRGVPPVLADTIAPEDNAPLLPPAGSPPYDPDGDFLFDARNVYFNAPVDFDIVSAPAIGSAGVIRFFLDHQRTSPGSFPNLDWPILLEEKPVAPDGSVATLAPAHVPLFEQLRTAAGGAGAVPLTRGPLGVSGAAHVAGLNFGRPGQVATCVGCHAGHTMIPPPPSAEAARWTNLAPGAAVTVSSTRDANQNGGLIDRRVLKGEIWRYWNSAAGEQDGAWARLTFPVPVTVRTVRLFNPRFGGEASSTIQVVQATVRLFSDAAGTQQVASAGAAALSVSGTDVAFADVGTRVVEVRLDDVSGTFYGLSVAALAEIEVVARGGVDP